MLINKINQNIPQNPKYPITISIFGSTGSIGLSTLEIIRKHPDKFKVNTLTAGKNFKLLAAQINEFSPLNAALNDPQSFKQLMTDPELEKLQINKTVNFFCGENEINDLASDKGNDLLVAAIVGFAGLSSVIAALKAGVNVALANKESLVCAGQLLSDICQATSAKLLPLDSEHSAIFQLIQAAGDKDLESITLTASGGPFLHKPAQEFPNVTLEQALKHPKWNMGAKVSIDSATMFNKALELIEAVWFFALPPEKVKVLVHPESIIHSLINFVDGTSLAQMSMPDMQAPIAYSLHYPYGRLGNIMPELKLTELGTLNFLELDQSKFPAVEMARQSFKHGKAAQAVFNFANEIAVSKFIDGKLGFDKISGFTANAMEVFADRSYGSYEELRDLYLEIKKVLG